MCRPQMSAAYSLVCNKLLTKPSYSSRASKPELGLLRSGDLAVALLQTDALHHAYKSVVASTMFFLVQVLDILSSKPSG
jgi:hypothetical protein